MTENTFALRQRDGTAQWHSLAHVPGGLQLTVGYRRCLDFDLPDLPGQDFACLTLDRSSIVAVVADGVSQSFLGDIAARHVGSHLARLLWDRRTAPPDGQTVRAELERIRPAVEREVQQFQFDRETPAMVRAALDDARLTAGSQACFGAAIIDLTRRSATLYVLGDVTVLTHRADGTAIPYEGDRRGRWSSLHGMRKVETAVEVVSDLRALTIKSDGMGADWGLDLVRVHDPAAFRAVSIDRASIDDMSFIAIDLVSGMPAMPLQLQPLRRVESEPIASSRAVEAAASNEPWDRSRPTPADPSHAMHGQLHAASLYTGPQAPATHDAHLVPPQFAHAPAPEVRGPSHITPPLPAALCSPSTIEDLVNEQHRQSRPPRDGADVPKTVGYEEIRGIAPESAQPMPPRQPQLSAAERAARPLQFEAGDGLSAAFASASEPPPSPSVRTVPQALSSSKTSRVQPAGDAWDARPSTAPEQKLTSRIFRWLLGLVLVTITTVGAFVLGRESAETAPDSPRKSRIDGNQGRVSTTPNPLVPGSVLPPAGATTLPAIDAAGPRLQGPSLAHDGGLARAPSLQGNGPPPSKVEVPPRHPLPTQQGPGVFPNAAQTRALPLGPGRAALRSPAREAADARPRLEPSPSEPEPDLPSALISPARGTSVLQSRSQE